MISISRNIQSEILMTTMEELVPENSLFRKVDKYIDFTFIYDLVKNKYNFDIKRCAVDSGYDTIDIRKYYHENNIFGVIGYRRYGTKKSRKENAKYEYNKELDLYIEKDTGEVLEYTKYIDRI